MTAPTKVQFVGEQLLLMAVQAGDQGHWMPARAYLIEALKLLRDPDAGQVGR